MSARIGILMMGETMSRTHGRLARIQRRGAISACLILVGACTDRAPTAPTPGPTTPTQSRLDSLVIVSAPIAQLISASDAIVTGATNARSTTNVAAASAVYVSLPPGSVPSASKATIRNRRTGDAIEVSMVDGGFDPIPITAVVDDNLTIDISGGTSVPLSASVRVPKRRPPTIVRSEPPNGKTDVPLNTQIEVVFSEPVDPTTIPAGLQLFQSGQIVSGVATGKSSGLVGEFAPSASLAPNTEYTLSITTAVRDLAGDGLEQTARVNFTTGSGTEADQPPPSSNSCSSTTTMKSSAAGISTSVGSMSQTHGDMTTLLPDGRVLVFGGTPFNALVWGGVPDTTIRPVAEMYDPVAKSFSSADDMITFRGGHPAVALPEGKLQFLDGTVLQDGRVFFAGPNSAEIYDPVAGSFMPTSGYAHTDPQTTWTTRTLLQDGRVLLTGIVGTPQQFFGATEVFDPKTGTFKKTGNMHGWSDTPGLGILLADGTVLIVQWNFDVSSDVAELYDPSTETFNTIGCIYLSHEYSAGVRLRDGTALITGGQLPGGNGSTETVLYMPSAHTFVEGPPMNTGRHSHSATLLLDGTVLVAGGYGIWPNPTRTAEILHPTP